jgi:hypothetical protein
MKRNLMDAAVLSVSFRKILPFEIYPNFIVSLLLLFCLPFLSEETDPPVYRGFLPEHHRIFKIHIK